MEASPQQMGSFPSLADFLVLKSFRPTHTWELFEDRLRFNRNTDVIVRKAQQHFYCLRELNSFGVDQTMLSALLRVF